jgi:Mrp family chromosome partitioning ATPase/capsular polysaccharide biosynthesis protein
VQTVSLSADTQERDSIHEFVGVLRRRWVALLIPIIVTPLIALGHSILQDPRFSASADVLVTSGSVASALSDLPGLSSPDQPERNARTQVGLARLPRVAQRVIDEAPLFEEPATFLRRSSVSVLPDADILRFSVEDENSDAAQRLATIYAQEFSQYRNALDVEAIRRTRATIARTMAKLAASGGRDSAVYAELRSAMRQLTAAEAVQGSAAILVQPAVAADQVAPRTMRDLVLAFALGAILGIGLAFLVERLDTRVRTAEEVESMIGLPVLGEIPRPPALPDTTRTKVSMLEFPYGSYAEGIRKLRANLEFANLDVGARIIMVTSALGGEGKTTTAADLAVALARSGRKVVLCDLDSRAPAVDRAFDLGERRGLVEVAFGLEPLERALVSIPIANVRTSVTAVGAAGLDAGTAVLLGDPRDRVAPKPDGARGELSVLPFGRRRPPSPADFVGSSTVRQLIAQLAASHDFVVLDTPPFVPVSDALTISEYADSALIVSGLATSTRPTLRTVRKFASAFPTRLLGVVVTGVADAPGYGPYYVGEHAAAEPPPRVSG